jgi:hypothetical protein
VELLRERWLAPEQGEIGPVMFPGDHSSARPCPPAATGHFSFSFRPMVCKSFISFKVFGPYRADPRRDPVRTNLMSHSEKPVDVRDWLDKERAAAPEVALHGRGKMIALVLMRLCQSNAYLCEANAY